METKRFFGLLLLSLVLCASLENSSVMMVEGRICESKSHQFKGVCLSDHNCGLVCRDEHFTDGRCRGARHRCFCTRSC